MHQGKLIDISVFPLMALCNSQKLTDILQLCFISILKETKNFLHENTPEIFPGLAF